MSVSLSTVKKWIKDVEGLGEWLLYDESSGNVTRIFCKLCSKHQDRLRAVRNFNSAFVVGITGTALKKDNVCKHQRSDIHAKAINMDRQPTISEIYRSTPLGRAFASANSEETGRVSKLFEIAYMLAKEELPFTKYCAVVELEKKHGVSLGNAYATEHKCRDFTVLIGESMRDDVLQKSQYLAVLMDGSTDSSVVEKELIYVMFVGADGKVECRFFQLKDVPDATSSGIKSLLLESFAEFGMDLAQKLVSICVDGAAVNLGVRRGLSTLLKQESPWLVSIHCMNHRLELAAKDAFSTIAFMNEVSTMLSNLHTVYEKSPKRLLELRRMADIMEESIRKPDKATGTRWVQHKSRALKALILGYSVIVAHLEAMASEESSVKAVDKIKFKGYWTKLTSYKFILHMLFFDALLDPLAALSCCLQGSSADLPLAVARLKAFHSTLAKLKEDNTETPTELSKLIAATNCESGITFRGVKLNGVSSVVQQAFKNSRSTLVNKVSECVKDRFDDLETMDIMKGVRILDFKMWPMETAAFETFGDLEISLLVDHFKTLLEKNGVSLGAISTEWSAFKHYSVQNLQGNSNIWPLLLTYHREKFPNLCHLIEILQVFPISNAKVERGFSTMRRIKTDWRSRLAEETLDHLMRISIDGVPQSQFNPIPAVQRFFSTPRRPNINPYGSRKRNHSELENDDV